MQRYKLHRQIEKADLLAGKKSRLNDEEKWLLQSYIMKFTLHDNLFDLVEVVKIALKVLKKEEFPLERLITVNIKDVKKIHRKKNKRK